MYLLLRVQNLCPSKIGKTYGDSISLRKFNFIPKFIKEVFGGGGGVYGCSEVAYYLNKSFDLGIQVYAMLTTKQLSLNKWQNGSDVLKMHRTFYY